MIDDIAESSGTSAQVEWAKMIKRSVAAEFDRVAAAFKVVAGNQQGSRLARTEAVLLILDEIRVTVLANDQAGYFIRDWHEINDQVRQMTFATHATRHGFALHNRQTPIKLLGDLWPSV